MQKTLLILIIWSASFLSDRAFACAYQVWGEEYRYHLLFPETSGTNQMLLPFHFSSAWMFKNPSDFEELGKWKNISDWRKHARNSSDSVIWYTMMYQRTYPELLASEREDISTFINGLDDATRKTFLFIKKVEDHYGDYTPWLSARYHYNLDHKQCMEEAKVLYAQLDEPHLKCRIAYQMVRMADSDDFTSIWNTYLEPVKTSTIVGNWALRYLAGQLQKEEKKAEANRLHAVLFDLCDEWKYHAYFNFSRGILKESLKACTTPEEEATLSMLDLLKKYKPAIEDLERFVKAYPDYKNLDMLVLREINKMEDQVYTELYTQNNPAIYEWWDWENELPSMMQRKIYQKRLNRLVWKEALKRPNKAFWNMAAGYLAALDHAYPMAKQFLEHAEACQKTSGEKLQLDMLSIVFQSMAIPEDDNGYLNQLAISFNRIYKTLYSINKGQSMLSNFALALAAILEGKKHYLPATLCNSYVLHYRADHYSSHGAAWTRNVPLSEKKNDRNWAGAMNMFFYLEKQVPTENLVAIEYWVHQKKSKELEEFAKHLTAEKYRITDLLGTRYFLASQYKQSLQTFDRIPDIWWDTCQWEVYAHIDGYAFDDILSYIKSPFRFGGVHKTNKCIIADSLYHWSETGKGPGEEAAIAQFKLANLLLNTCERGQAWAMSRYWNHSYDAAGEYGYTYAKGIESKLDEDYFGEKRALQAYLKASELSSDPKIKAAALAHAAAIECPLPEFLKIQRQRKAYGYSKAAGPSLNKLLDMYPELVEEIYADCPGVDSYLSIH